MGSDAPTLRTIEKALNERASGGVVAFAAPLKRYVPKQEASYAKAVARLAVFAYIIGFAVDLNINALLILLASCSVAAVWLSSGEKRPSPRSPIIYLVGFFLLVAGLSILLSEDIARSLRLSAPLIPRFFCSF